VQSAMDNLTKTKHNATYKTKIMRNTDPIEKPDWTQLVAKSKKFLFLL